MFKIIYWDRFADQVGRMCRDVTQIVYIYYCVYSTSDLDKSSLDVSLVPFDTLLSSVCRRPLSLPGSVLSQPQPAWKKHGCMSLPFSIIEPALNLFTTHFVTVFKVYKTYREERVKNFYFYFIYVGINMFIEILIVKHSLTQHIVVQAYDRFNKLYSKLKHKKTNLSH